MEQAIATVASGVIACSLISLGVVFYGWVRPRHARPFHPVFGLFGATLVFSGIDRLLILLFPAVYSGTVLATARTVIALVAVVTVAWLLYALPDVLAILSAQRLLDINQQLRDEVRRLSLRVGSMVETGHPEDAQEVLTATIDQLQNLDVVLAAGGLVEARQQVRIIIDRLRALNGIGRG